MKKPSDVLESTPFDLSFYSIRNISCPEDVESNRKIYSGHAPLSSVLAIPTDENVRSYLVEAQGKQRRTYTSVHRAIKDTLLNYPSNFSVLNTGLTIVARGIDINETGKIAKLIKPSIINGAQTQGVLSDLDEDGNLPDVHIKFEIIVTNNEELIAETSISRNYQNNVMTISIVGRRGLLDELEQNFQIDFPGLKLRKSETELTFDDSFVDTEKLIQVLMALIPPALWMKKEDTDNPNKVFTYSMKAKCLKDFQEIYNSAKNPTDVNHQKSEKIYQFFLDIVADAYRLYLKWKSHPEFYSTRIKSIERDAKGNIVSVPDGIIFPILAALSVFATKTQKGWKITPPPLFKDVDVIKAAKTALMEMAGHNPQTMGKSKACYSQLIQITSIYKRLSD